MQADGPVNALAVDSSVLELFWSLASLDARTREDAAAQLVDQCARAQQSHVAASGSGAMAERFSPLVTYTLNRLIKGLASNRQGARQGFALTLTGVMTSVGDMSVSEALDALHTHSEQLAGSSKGPEARGILIGNLFGYASVARMVKLRAQQSGQPPSPATLGRLVQEVMSLSQKKGYLREPASVIALDLLQGESAPTVATVLQAAPALVDVLTCPVQDARAEHILVALGLLDRMPSALLARCHLLPHSGQVSDFFERSHLAALLPALMQSTAVHPRVHAAWSVITALLQSCAVEGSGAVATFWETVEQTLFTSSHERKYLGFQLFTLLLPVLPAEQVPTLFSSNFMRCMVNNLGKEQTLLHPSASKCLSNLLDHVTSTAGSGLKSAVIAALQRFTGGQFDRLTQSHAVSALMQSLSGTSAEEYAEQLISSFVTGTPVGDAGGALHAIEGAADGDSDTAQRVLTGRRTWTIEQLSGLCRGKNIAPTLLARILRVFLVHGFFQFTSGAEAGDAKLLELQGGPPEPVVEPSVRDLCRTRLFGLVGDVLSGSSAQANKKGAGEAAEPAVEVVEEEPGVDVVAELLRACHQAERAKAVVTPVCALDDHAQGVRKDVRAVLKELERLAQDGTSPRLESAVNLVRVLLLYQLATPAEFTSDIEDLPRSLRAAFGAAAAEAPAGKGEPHHMDVLVDSLLSMVSKPHALIRDVAEKVVKAFSGDITHKGIRRMMSQLTRATDSRRGRTSRGGGGDGDEEDEDTDDADASDDDDSSEEEEEDGAAEEDGEDAEAPPRAAAGGEPASDSDVEDAADAMDDAAMLNSDVMLSAVLREAKKDRVEKKTAAESVLHFKFRVLSLVEAFVKSQLSSPLLSETVLPLLRALVMSAKGKEEALGTRIASLIINFISKAPVAAAAGVSVQQLCNTFTACMRRASMASTHTVMRASQAAAIYVLRLIAACEESAGQLTAPLVEAALERCYAQKKSRLTHGFFCTIMERMPVVGGAVCRHSSQYLVATSQKQRVKSRHEHLVLESVKLLDKALRHKPASKAVAVVAAAVDFKEVTRGLTAAVALTLTKAKRQTELGKYAALSAQAMVRLCAGAGLAAPDLTALRAAIAAAKPSLPPKAAGHLDRMLASLRPQGADAGAPADRKRTKDSTAEQRPAKRKK